MLHSLMTKLKARAEPQTKASLLSFILPKGSVEAFILEYQEYEILYRTTGLTYPKLVPVARTIESPSHGPSTDAFLVFESVQPLDMALELGRMPLPDS